MSTALRKSTFASTQAVSSCLNSPDATVPSSRTSSCSVLPQLHPSRSPNTIVPSIRPQTVPHQRHLFHPYAMQHVLPPNNSQAVPSCRPPSCSVLPSLSPVLLQLSPLSPCSKAENHLPPQHAIERHVRHITMDGNTQNRSPSTHIPNRNRSKPDNG